MPEDTLVVGVDPSYVAAHYALWDGGPLSEFDTITVKGDLTRQVNVWRELFVRLLEREPFLAIEDQWAGKDFRAIQKVILARGVCEGAYRAVYSRDPIIVPPRAWQASVGAPFGAKRPVCEAYAKDFAHKVAGRKIANQHQREALCIAVTTLDKIRCGRLAG